MGGVREHSAIKSSKLLLFADHIIIFYIIGRFYSVLIIIIIIIITIIISSVVTILEATLGLAPGYHGSFPSPLIHSHLSGFIKRFIQDFV